MYQNHVIKLDISLSIYCSLRQQIIKFNGKGWVGWVSQLKNPRDIFLRKLTRVKETQL